MSRTVLQKWKSNRFGMVQNLNLTTLHLFNANWNGDVHLKALIKSVVYSTPLVKLSNL